MQFSPPLSSGKLIKRYKRFLADVELPKGDILTVHCPNTGSMLACKDPGAPIWYSTSGNKNRKYPHTWELIEVSDGSVVGVNTSRPNQLVCEAIEQGVIEELQNYSEIRKEVAYGEQNSRIDLLLLNDNEQCFVEIKNVTLSLEENVALFPDAVTTRGKKHLEELMEMKKIGHRAVLFYCVQHSGVDKVKPAYDIDPEYCLTLQKAIDKGVEVIAYRAKLFPDLIELDRRIPFTL